MSKFAKLALEVDKPARMIIVHPILRQPLRNATGDEAYIDLYSADSAPARKHTASVARKRLNMRRGGKLTPEEIEAEAVELLCALTAGWELFDLEGDALEIPFNHENARDAYREPGLSWLREQVDEFVADRGNFSKASSTN